MEHSSSLPLASDELERVDGPRDLRKVAARLQANVTAAGDRWKRLPLVTISQLVLSNAGVRGDRIAFQDDDRAVDYRQLERRTRSLAGRLGAEWLQPGDRAAILLGNRVEAMESYIAIVRTGAVGVPLNPLMSDAELSYVLQDSGCRVIITDRANAERHRLMVPFDRAPEVVVVGDARVPEGALSFESLADVEAPAPPPRDDLALDDVAWIFYSSGTTGQPKGVLSSQRSYLWSASASYLSVLGLSEADRMLLPVPLYHAFAYSLCVGVLQAGATAHIMTGFDADEVAALLDTGSYTLLAGVPTMFHHLVTTARRRDAAPVGPRICIVAGAPSSSELRRSWEETFHVPLVDGYGATELCGVATLNWPAENRTGESCGLPLRGLDVRLMDPDTGADVSSSGEGEMWFSGPSVMSGYHNLPKETATTLVDGWYRTGDLAGTDRAGRLTVTGRIKEIIIRGGENIYPAEIEHVIARIPSVADVAVAAKNHEELGQVPVAFVVAEGGAINVQAIFDACRTQLTAFKVPSEIHQVDVVPRSSSGKILRRQLWERPTRLLGTADASSFLNEHCQPKGRP
ncbi:class I adenylate-forming enzyme family protein [Streptomyces sp. NPDC001034]|uniref:class I adenylate-forming enzyme family protein n=1 Tax=Streptomyces sp. NPDC001034 TaxID=3154375 RepID=UPI0033320244